ncbi:MAG: GNAT family N-acetyltransferase [Candidatus Ornithomonoglobus sp.]
MYTFLSVTLHRLLRKATFDDIKLIEDTYNEHFKHEIDNGAFTVFKKGIYPTRKDAEKAMNAGALYVYEENNNIAGSIIMDKAQPTEYTGIDWGQTLRSDEVMVIHLLMIRPGMYGKGIATSLVKYAMELAKNNSCKALRLDTGSQNIPAISLYKKLGFQIVATGFIKVGGTIEHSGHLFLEKLL